VKHARGAGELRSGASCKSERKQIPKLASLSSRELRKRGQWDQNIPSAIRLLMQASSENIASSKAEKSPRVWGPIRMRRKGRKRLDRNNLEGWGRECWRGREHVSSDTGGKKIQEEKV